MKLAPPPGESNLPKSRRKIASALCILVLLMQFYSTWQGKVQHPAKGSWRYVQDGEDLVLFLQTQITELATRPLPPL